MNEQLDPKRLETVRHAAERWRERLIDVSGRNRLLNYRDLKVGTMELTPGPESLISGSSIDALLNGKAIYLKDIFEDSWQLSARTTRTRGSRAEQAGLFADTAHLVDARKRLTAIYRKDKELYDEKGISTSFAAIGLASWKAESASVPNAPVILVPINITPVDVARMDFKIEMAGDPHLNPVLAYVLQTSFGIDLEGQDIDVSSELSTSLSGLLQLLRQLEVEWPTVPDLAIAPRMVLGNFSYTNMPMVEDLKNSVELLARNDLISAIAGVDEARQILEANIQDPLPNQPDIDPPESEFLVLDADSSQNLAINRALNGKPMVIWGPPGTGKSQTIANLIATLIARGKSVLFVAEKRAAIDMVIRRLDSTGLSDLVMDIHGGVKSKREFARSLGASMQNISSTPASDYSSLHDGLSNSKSELIGYEEALHRPRNTWNMSAHEVFTKHVGAPQDVRGIPPVPSDIARRISRQYMDRLMENVRIWIDHGGPDFHSQFPEWSNSDIKSQEEAATAYELVRDLSSTVLPMIRTEAFAGLESVGIAPPESARDWLSLLLFLQQVSDTLDRFRPEVYSLNHPQLLRALEPALRWWSGPIAFLSPKYRVAMRALQATVRRGDLSSGIEAYHVVRSVQEQAQAWKKLSTSTSPPRPPEGLEALKSVVSNLDRELGKLGLLLGLTDLPALPLSELEELLMRLASQNVAAANLLDIRKLERAFAESGVNEITSTIGKTIPLEHAEAAVEHSWLRAVADDILLRDPQLSSFTQAAHSRNQANFVRMDRQHLTTSAQRIKRAAAEAAVDSMNAHRQETYLLQAQAGRSRGHLPVRRLLRQAPNVLTAIRPCWTMSPLMVAELLPPVSSLFDVVIFDEASQIPPAEAIGSLARAPQAVIAGDELQLPPTTFFQKELEDEEVDEGEDDDDVVPAMQIEHFDSLLNVAQSDIAIRKEQLKWHYRSRDDRLIAFSNTYIYDDTLTTFPGVSAESPFSFHLVPFRPLTSRSRRSHPDEVTLVVDLIVEHARNHPSESLGVIAFGTEHANNIDDELRKQLRELGDQSLEGFFSDESQEPFFIKNIERVQGDERDVIILSIGYHKDNNGSLPHRFGPINQEGGERRLNVAATRARSRTHVVSSFSHYDIDPSRSNARGVELLRRYLEYVSSGGNELPSTASRHPLNSFELDVKIRLESKGIPITPQYGVSGYRIDFACAHPSQPGRMVLAIETDGSIHKVPTVRERDRLRQQALEDKGWRFHRISSTAWFRDRESEAERAFQAWKEAVRAADAGPTSPLSIASMAAESSEPASVKPEPRARGPKPRIPPGLSIDRYSLSELRQIAMWICSDTLLRTDEQLMAEMREFLGFRRRGRRIDEAFSRAIAGVRRRQSRS